MTSERKEVIEKLLQEKKVKIETFKNKKSFSYNNQSVGVRIINNTILQNHNITEPELMEILLTASDIQPCAFDMKQEQEKLQKEVQKEQEKLQKENQKHKEQEIKLQMKKDSSANRIQSGEELSYDMNELNILFDTSVPRWVIPHQDKSLGVMKLSIDEICAKIRFHRERCQKPEINKNAILDYTTDIECTERMRILAEFKPKLAYNPNITNSQCDSLFEKLARILSNTNYHKMYPIILRHMVWTVKRRLYDLPDYCPILINFYSDAGGGKSEAINQMFSIFPDMLKSSGVNASSMFEDDRFYYMFTDNYVVIMNELTGMNKADIASLKNMIDQRIINYRALGYNRSAKGKNCAQLFGSSNARIRNLVIADKDVRKWCEIDFFSYPDNEIDEKMLLPLRTFDWLTLWRGVDENADSPFHDGNIYKDYRKWVNETCVTQTPTVEWIIKFILNQNGSDNVKKMDDGYNKILVTNIWDLYKKTMTDDDSNIQSKSKFLDLLLGYKFTRLNRNNDGIYYKIPKAEECPYIVEDDVLQKIKHELYEKELTIEDLL